MIRLRNAILAVVMSLFATGALGQGFVQDSESVTVASELFGGGSVKLEFGEANFEPKAKLIFMGVENAATSIQPNTEFEVTLTLTNATFAESVSNTDFMWGTWGPASNDRLESEGCMVEGPARPEAEQTNAVLSRRSFCPMPNEVTIERDGGGKNTNSVSFTITVGSGVLADNVNPVRSVSDDTPPVTTYAGVTRKIVFVMPDLNASGLRAEGENSPTDKGVQVMASWDIAQTKSNGTTVITEAVLENTKCGGVGEGKAAIDCTIIDAAQVVSEVAASKGGGSISLTPTDERSVLVGGNGKASDPQRVRLATVSVTADYGLARDQDGDLITGFTGDLAGSLAIRVSSDSFNEGDVVYIDTDDSKTVNGREAFEMDGGVAFDTVPLPITDAETTSMVVYYVPSGDMPLKHRTTFTTTVNTEFADTDARNRAATPATAMLKLFGIKDEVAKAYAIAPTTGTDMANLRVTCESSAKAGCNVFLDCHDSDGMNTFGEAGMMVGPNATAHMNQMGVQDALGLDASWSGRLSCDVLSSAPISVQVLTRANGVLVNNTSVNEGGN